MARKAAFSIRDIDARTLWPETDGGLSQSQSITHGREEVELPVQLLSFASAEGTDVKTLGPWVTQYLAFSEPCPFLSGGCDCKSSLQLVRMKGTGRESGSDSGARSLLTKPKCMAADGSHCPGYTLQSPRELRNVSMPRLPPAQSRLSLQKTQQQGGKDRQTAGPSRAHVEPRSACVFRHKATVTDREAGALAGAHTSLAWELQKVKENFHQGPEVLGPGCALCRQGSPPVVTPSSGTKTVTAA
ncbi:unnamed protein product [Rangifer tarandus platyrhynchus]|uniref:Uncharacterized protein n=2 Tax=Rangifer tarandus platyrhynchus TaxID=3082113 RepID=A0ACB0EGH2_RANTA|nr:unnamed protein product [Rangifer tarandus platyrhynchus]CAI9699671.1 unnamed protein product [Rangifer tarandus platyrhynchus]